MDQQTQPASQPPAPAVPRPAQGGMSAGAKWAIGCGAFISLVIVALLVLMLVAIVGIMGAATAGRGLPRGNVALIRIEGPITAGAAGGGPFGAAASAESIVGQLQKAAEQDQIKAIILRINSPGGSAAGAQEMYQEVRRIRSRGKPVYVSMGDVAASGGYYIAAAANRIFADAGTMTGSIGVISATLDLSGLFDKIGVQPQVVKEGKFKDMGSGLRPLTDNEREIVQGLLANVYEQFINDVAAGRNLPKEEVRKLATGQVYTGQQALKLKLVDELGGLRPAVLAVAKEAGIKGKPQVVEFRRRTLFDYLLGDVNAAQSAGMKGLLYDRLADLVTRGALRAEEQSLP